MKKSLLLAFAVPSLLFAQSQRQTVYVTAPDCFVQGFTPLAGGGNLLSGFSRYGTDSCLMNLVFMNDSDVTVSHKEFNTATHFDFLSHVVPVANGFLIGGKSSDPSFFHPQLIKTDLNGNVLWAKYFDNTSYWQGQIIRIIPNGSNYSMYTFAETPFNDFYRIETDANGSSFSGSQYMPDTTMSFRIFDGEAQVNSTSHILCGHANFNSTTTRGGLLMKTTPSGIQWCKHITAGGNFKNDIIDVTAGADGNSYSVFVCENMPGNQYSTIILKFDSLGNKIWTKQLSLSSATLNGCSIVESMSHDLYVASYDNLFNAYITKLDGAGNLIWTHKWNPSASGGAQALKLFKDSNGNIVFTGMLDNSYFVARLDANAGGCEFTNSSVIGGSAATIVLTNITFTTTAFAPSTVTENVLYSSLHYSESMICGGVGIDEPETGTIRIYPNPAGNNFNFDSSVFPGGNEVEVSLFNLVGEKIWTGQRVSGGGTTIDISFLASGIYLFEARAGEKNFHSRLVKE